MPPQVAAQEQLLPPSDSGEDVFPTEALLGIGKGGAERHGSGPSDLAAIIAEYLSVQKPNI